MSADKQTDHADDLMRRVMSEMGKRGAAKRWSNTSDDQKDAHIRKMVAARIKAQRKRKKTKGK